MKAVITVTGKDTVGIIADVATVCANNGANILWADGHVATNMTAAANERDVDWVKKMYGVDGEAEGDCYEGPKRDQEKWGRKYW